MQQLLTHLEELVITYGQLPAQERMPRLARDAERITGEVARHLGAARATIGAVPTPR